MNDPKNTITAPPDALQWTRPELLKHTAVRLPESLIEHYKAIAILEDISYSSAVRLGLVGSALALKFIMDQLENARSELAKHDSKNQLQKARLNENIKLQIEQLKEIEKILKGE